MQRVGMDRREYLSQLSKSNSASNLYGTKGARPMVYQTPKRTSKVLAFSQKQSAIKASGVAVPRPAYHTVYHASQVLKQESETEAITLYFHDRKSGCKMQTSEMKTTDPKQSIKSIIFETASKKN